MPSKHSDLVKQLQRAFMLLRDLDRMDGMDKYEMSARLGISVRSVERYLSDLQAMGLPLVRELDGRRSVWRIAYKDRMRKLASLFDLSQYMALRLAMGAGGPSRKLGAQFAALEELSDSMEEQLGGGLRQRMERINAAFLSVDRFSYLNAPIDVVWPLIESIAERTLCEVTYRAARVQPEDKSYLILPIKLFVHDHALYVLCHVHGKKNVTTLNTQRLRNLKRTGRTAELPAGFDLATWERQAFQLVASEKQATFKLRFAPAIAVYIREREWHPEQKIKELDDGGLTLTFTCADTYEVAAWVSSWRDGVEVLEPQSLREAMREQGAFYRKTYGEVRPPA